MKITLVVDQFYQLNNGTSISAQRVYNALTQNGHVVNIVAIDDGSHTKFALKERYFGKIPTKIINSQGFHFAKPDLLVLEDAIKQSDIVHIYLPFKLEYTAIKLCKKLNVPCTAGFHLLPENITSTIFLNKCKLINNILWKYFYSKTYRFVQHIHTPTVMVANQLLKHKYGGSFHIISNGYDKDFNYNPQPKPEEYKNKFVICCVGRFSREKKQKLLVKAIKLCKYSDNIQLIFAGNGPLKKSLKKYSKNLKNFPVFTFLDKQQLISLYNYADLYVHPAEIEVEGMSCLEAIACGLPALVSNSNKSATKQFTKHNQSVFKNNNALDLANKIDWWIEHQDELLKQKSVVLNLSKQYSLDNSVNYYISMFESAISDWNKNYKADKNKTTIINPYIKE